MTAMSDELKVGDVVGAYRVTEVCALGPLPRAVIVGGPNAGVEVYLTSGTKGASA